jgi:hypothetical protein
LSFANTDAVKETPTLSFLKPAEKKEGGLFEKPSEKKETSLFGDKPKETASLFGN